VIRTRRLITGDGSQDELRSGLAQIRAEPLPDSRIGREEYFLAHRAAGEELMKQGTFHHFLFLGGFAAPFVLFISTLTGPSARLPAALEFYRAMRAYPHPATVLGIYEKTVNREVVEVRGFS
jgi:mitochondrial import receptor subunit TOM20